MEKNLVIVESPAKAKTIAKALGEGFEVASSFGHIRDLSKKKLGIDLENGFEPEYEVDRGKKDLIKKLTTSSEAAHLVWLASDDDREGEAIAWHLKETLNIPDHKVRRIAFHEITKDAIKKAVENPRDIDMDLVLAQQARRILDRLVGYELSPVLWRKVKPGLSAGRVQSVAVRLVVDREREIIQFTPSSSFKVEGMFTCLERSKTPFKGTLNKRFTTTEEASAFLQASIGATYTVARVEKKKGRKSPAPPFTTSTLQQEASRKLGFSVSQTMRVAQSLYESGRITYMRTDSTQLSSLALGMAKKVITETYGQEYSKTRQYATRSKTAQEAHEAIRPTFLETEEIKGSAAEKKLYGLIRKRTLASQMADALLDKTQITIGISQSDYTYVATGEVIVFDGFLKVYKESVDDEQEGAENNKGGQLPKVQSDDVLQADQVRAVQRFTQPPFRYTEAGLVKKMEELGIGRPSTYAPTLSTILQRNYVVKTDLPPKQREYIEIQLLEDRLAQKKHTENYGEERGKLFPQDTGILVNDYLEEHFPSIVDYNFTAHVEEDFDRIASGKLLWNAMLKNFYGPFSKTVNSALETTRTSAEERLLGTDPKTGKPVFVRFGRYGAMAQLGEKDDPEKRFAGLRKGQLIESITLEEALELFRLPRELGLYKDAPIVVATGRYGPYIKWQGKNTSLHKTDDPYKISLERGVELIEQAAELQEKKHIQEFPQEGISILRGRYGPYIQYKKKNYRIPKGTTPEDMTLEDCMAIIQTKDNESKKGKE